MELTFDIGNTQISVCLWNEDKILSESAKPTEICSNKEDFSFWIKDFLQKEYTELIQIESAGISSVVPSVNENMAKLVKDLFCIEPFFISSITAGITINYDIPEKLGADRIAAAIGASKLYPGKNLIVVDMGTATTIDCITKENVFAGGIIMPGLRISMESLVKDTALLSSVEITIPKKVCATNTINGIQSGLYFGHAGAIKEICGLYQKEIFDNQKVYVIGTGGFSKLYSQYGFFDEIEQNLVHLGIKKVLNKNFK